MKFDYFSDGGGAVSFISPNFRYSLLFAKGQLFMYKNVTENLSLYLN